MIEPAATAVHYKIASEEWELQQIHQLNYQTFVEEIPQHPANGRQLLVDRFHCQNTYVIAVRERQLLGMLALRGERPFSLDQKLPDLDRHLPPGRRVCEVRLLATAKTRRNGVIFRGLVDRLVAHGLECGYDLAVISGAVRQAKLYRHIGFVPFGPVVGAGAALFQPMYLALETLRQRGKAFRALQTIRPRRADEPLNFLPGPVAVHAEVAAALARTAVSHRSAAFHRDFRNLRQQLCRLANAAHVQILMGSGTLANDVVAAQLSRWPGPGLVLSNGAFGDRLVDHATRFGLRFHALRLPWGEVFERRQVEAAIDEVASPRWLWAVHGETSTGVLNDLSLLKEAARARGLKLCLDAVSSLGAAPADLDGVALASGVSGKALGAFSGLALVFHEADVARAPDLPRYLDLGHYAEHDGLPFTVSSNLVYALQAALDRFEGDRRFARVESLAEQLRQGLRDMGLTPLASSFHAVTTIALPPPCRAEALGQRLEDAGYLLSYRSDYLLERNWLQVCLMGTCTPAAVDELLGALRAALDQERFRRPLAPREETASSMAPIAW